MTIYSTVLSISFFVVASILATVGMTKMYTNFNDSPTGSTRWKLFFERLILSVVISGILLVMTPVFFTGIGNHLAIVLAIAGISFHAINLMDTNKKWKLNAMTGFLLGLTLLSLSVVYYYNF